MPDYEIWVCATSQAKSKANHLDQTKIILRCVNGSCNLDILYSQDTNSILGRYCNVDCDVSI